MRTKNPQLYLSVSNLAVTQSENKHRDANKTVHTPVHTHHVRLCKYMEIQYKIALTMSNTTTANTALDQESPS